MNYFSFKNRLLFGVSIFTILGIIDLIKNPKNPRRFQEYLFLFSVAGLSMFYGFIHDFITYKISPDYYILSKGIESAIHGFNKDVVYLALKATWSVGLIIGVSFLLANNPQKERPQLKYKTLYKVLSYPLSTSILFAIILGISFNIFASIPIFPWDKILEPVSYKRVMTSWGVHIGSYAGGLAGIILGVFHIKKLRLKK